MQFYPPISNLVTMEMCETTFILLTPLCTLRANGTLTYTTLFSEKYPIVFANRPYAR